jgi:hypothetical protein
LLRATGRERGGLCPIGRAGRAVRQGQLKRLTSLCTAGVVEVVDNYVEKLNVSIRNQDFS